jgi:hypothetical protein
MKGLSCNNGVKNARDKRHGGVNCLGTGRCDWWSVKIDRGVLCILDKTGKVQLTWLGTAELNLKIGEED